MKGAAKAFAPCPFCGCRVGGSDISLVGPDGDEVANIHQADVVILHCACGGALTRDVSELTANGVEKWRYYLTEAWNERWTE